MKKDITSIAKFEEFFKENYKDNVFEILEMYPFVNSLVVDYPRLEIFDPDLADLLIDKPEEVIEAAKIAVKNIDPLAKGADLDIKFENVTNILPFEYLSKNYVGKLIVVEGVIDKIDKPKPIIDTAVFECQGCMRLHEVEQTYDRVLLTPLLCGACGGRSFRLLQEESSYIDTQIIVVTTRNTKRKLNVVLFNDDCSFDDYHRGDHIRITGRFATSEKDTKNLSFEYYLECNFIEFLDEEIEVFEEPDEKEYGDRSSPEYNKWKQHVVTRDKVCQCCGYDKHLEAHHIFGYENNKELRVNPDNGIALCVFCHKKFHSFAGRDGANPQRLIKFIRRFGVK